MYKAKESTFPNCTSADDKSLEKLSPAYGRTILSSFVALAGVIALLALSLVNEYQEANTHARMEAENFSRVLEEHALATVQKVDLLLIDVQRHVRPADMRLARNAGGQRAGELHAHLKSHRESVPEVSLLHLINAKGEHIHSALDALPSIILADRPYFQRQRDEPAAGLVISSPIVSRVTGNWTLILSRRINFEDGSFAGTVQASLKMEYFQQFYRSIDLGKQGLVALYDKELHLAARYPPSKKDMGNIANIHAKSYIEKGIKHATYHARSTLDGVERMYSFRQVGDLPLFVFAGIAEDDYLGEWRRHAWQYGIGLVILSLVVTTLGLRQRRGEEALRKSDESLRTIADHTYDWEYWEGPQRQLLYMSPSCEYITGYSLAEFMADPELLYRIIHPEDQHLMEEHHRDPNIQDKATIDFRIVRRDGEIRWVAHGCRAVYGTDGRSLGRRASNRDITERKRLETELQQLNDSLEQRVNEEVVRRMEQEDLLIQQSRLAAMGEMIGNIAHQWRQPINTLALLLTNLKDAYEYKELDKMLLDQSVEDGQRIIQKMSETIDDFRNFFKPNKEKQRFMALDAVVEAIKLVSHSFKNNNIEITQEKSTESCAVIGYPNEFAQVVLNALTNAKDAIVEKNILGKVHIQIEKWTDSATISIRDNGGGIPEEILSKVFDPYFTTKEKGTGIGLYMSKMIMDHMGGGITIHNIDGGAEVLLTLPLAEATGSKTLTCDEHS